MKWILVAIVVLLVGATVILSVRRRKPTAPPPSEEARRVEANEILKRLPTLEGYPFEVSYSATAHEQAVRLADVTRDAYGYFASLFPDAAPTFTAAYLAQGRLEARVWNAFVPAGGETVARRD